MRQWLSSSITFALKMFFASTLSLFGLFFVLAIVARLDIAFFESNGMLPNADLREAFYYQIFEFDGVMLGMIALGFVAVAALSFLFCKSQFDYFRHLSSAFALLAEKGEAPPTALLGRFNPYATYFFDIMSRRINGETEEGLEPLLARAAREWPKSPSVSWNDQLQFAAISGMLGMFFSACCVIVYLKVSGRVVELASSIVHYTSSTGPSFLTGQFEIINMLVWLILALTTVAFVMIGYRLGRQIAEADYAILRDLRSYMEGNFRQRLFLRSNDPAQEYVKPMNEALEKIAIRMRAQAAGLPADSAAAKASADGASGVPAVKIG